MHEELSIMALTLEIPPGVATLFGCVFVAKVVLASCIIDVMTRIVPGSGIQALALLPILTKRLGLLFISPITLPVRIFAVTVWAVVQDNTVGNEMLLFGPAALPLLLRIGITNALVA
jgi:hypothetical protein